MRIGGPAGFFRTAAGAYFFGSSQGYSPRLWRRANGSKRYTTLNTPYLNPHLWRESRLTLKVHIGNKTYDTDSATSLAGHRTRSSHQELFQTAEGDFFLYIHQIYVDGGNPLGPHDIWIDLRSSRNPNSRLQCKHGIRPVPRHEALEWCIKTQIPAPFRGLLLESI